MHLNAGFAANAALLPALCQAEGPVVTAQYDCVGCVHPISTASPELEPILTHAIQHFNNNTDHSHLFVLREVKKAQAQVCSLFLFILHSIIKFDRSLFLGFHYLK